VERAIRWAGAVLMSSVSLLLTVGLAQGGLMNGSFENGPDPGDAMALAPGSKAINDWTVVSGRISYVGRRWQHSHGARSVGVPCGGGFSQTFETEPDQKYEVRFSMAGDPTTAPPVKSVAVSFGAQTRLFTFDTTGHSLQEMGWDARSWIFTATALSTTVTFNSPTTECSMAAVDNVRIIGVEIDVRAGPEEMWRAGRAVHTGVAGLLLATGPGLAGDTVVAF